jgi:hypothetical protein
VSLKRMRTATSFGTWKKNRQFFFFFTYRLYCRQKVKIKNMTHRRQLIRLVYSYHLYCSLCLCVYLFFFFFGDLYCCPTKSNVKRHIIHTDTHAAQCYYETWKYRMPADGCLLMDDDGRYTQNITKKTGPAARERKK